MLVDEVAWGVENVGLDDRRRSLVEAFDFKDYEGEEHCGIGGGYGQFGILTEEEFLRVVKAPGKRVQKFTEFWGQHKEAIHVRTAKRNGIEDDWGERAKEILRGHAENKECAAASIPHSLMMQQASAPTSTI